MVDPVTWASVAQGVIKGIEIAKKEGWLDKLRTALKKRHRILVLGSTGVGKTQLIESLTDATPKAISAIIRTEFAQRHKIQIANTPFVFIDTPGQIHHGPRRKRAIREAMRTGISGVLNVVSYGYHESSFGKSTAITAEGKVRASFLADQRRKEILALREWTGHLGNQDTANWLITAITKADLWMHDWEKVLKHYQTGPYRKALKNAEQLEPVCLQYCSVMHKFMGEVKLSGDFDEADKRTFRGNLLTNLLQAVGRG